MAGVRKRIGVGGSVWGEGYQISHRPPTRQDVEAGEAAFAYDLTAIVPEDIYTHTQYYEDMGGVGVRESIAVLRKVRGKPEAVVTIYRGAPEPEINRGDWVTLSKAYALQYAGAGVYNYDGAKGRVYSAKVKAKDLTYEGNSINELGYVGKNLTGLKPVQ